MVRMEKGRRQETALLHSPSRRDAEGFLIVTSAADKGLVDIHDRRPLVLSPEVTLEWMRQDVGGKKAEELASDGVVPTEKFIWHAISRAVGNTANNHFSLIESINL